MFDRKILVISLYLMHLDLLIVSSVLIVYMGNSRRKIIMFKRHHKMPSNEHIMRADGAVKRIKMGIILEWIYICY